MSEIIGEPDASATGHIAADGSTAYAHDRAADDGMPLPTKIIGDTTTSDQRPENMARNLTAEAYAAAERRAAPVDPILQFFAWEHLPPHLQGVSRVFGELAGQLVNNLPRNPERTVALRKLLEAKDAAVRARLFKD